MPVWNTQTTHQHIEGFSTNPVLQKDLKRRRIKIAALILSAVAIIGISAKPCYRAFRSYMINQNLQAAMTAARLQDWGVARDKARSVLLVRQGDFEAFRIWTRALGKMGEPRAYMAAAQLFTDPRATREDQIETLQVMAIQAPQAITLSAYASLAKEKQNQASFRAAITPLLVKRGETDIAEKGLRQVMQPTDDANVQFELLRILCCRPEPARVTEARGIFAQLIARNADDEALNALLILGETPGGLIPGDPLPDLQKWLKEEPKATALHHLVGMNSLLDAQPEAADRLYESAVNRFLTTEPGVLGTWLVRHGKAEMAAKILEAPARTRQDAYIARLHALMRLRHEDEIGTALAAPPGSVDLVEMQIVRAALATQRGDRTLADAAWTQALNEASFDSNRNRFIEIANAAEGFGATGAATDAWVAAVRSGWGQLPFYNDLQKVFGSLASLGRSDDILAMCQTLVRFEPLNPDLRNNVSYLALLHGITLPGHVSKVMAELIADHPDNPEYYSTLMLAEMMDGRPADALAHLPKLRESRRVAPLMITALEGSARVLNGETDAGKALLLNVNWRYFMRQERTVFRDLLVKLKIADLPLPELEVQKQDVDPNQVPAWRRAIERSEKLRATDVLPALPAPHVPGKDLLENPKKP